MIRRFCETTRLSRQRTRYYNLLSAGGQFTAVGGDSLKPFRDTKITRNETSVAHGNELLIGFVKLITLAYKHIYFVPNSPVLIRQNNNTVAISLFRINFYLIY